jgi:hypothetical protein
MIPRTKARLAAGTLALGGLMCTALPAHAALTAPQANAFVVSAGAIGNLVAVPPTPNSSYPGPPTGTQTVVGLSVGPIATDATLTATTSGDPSTGDASASATVEQLGVTLPGATVALTGINSTCTATPAGATGSGIIASGKVTLAGIGLLPITLKANAAPNTGVTIPGIASVVLNQQSTDANGVLTVNAVHITLLGGAGADVIIGHAQCGGAPAVNTNPTPMISAPVAAGAGATAVVGGVVMLRRRNRGKGMFDAS